MRFGDVTGGRQGADPGRGRVDKRHDAERHTAENRHENRGYQPGVDRLRLRFGGSGRRMFAKRTVWGIIRNLFPALRTEHV